MHDQQGSGHGAIVTDSGRRTIALVGNPNVGKSVVFGYLTGRYVNVSNYPGTTVEITTGKLSGDHGDWEVIDTPGINNFIPSSEDEVVTRNILMEQNPTSILQVVDTKNLRRGLLLSLQLGEMGRPYVLCLNMADEARDRGITVDGAALGAALGVPVVNTIATQKVGLDEARRLALSSADPPQLVPIDYPAPIAQAVEELVPLLPGTELAPRSLALMLLAGGVPASGGTGDGVLVAWLESTVDETTRETIRSIIDRTRREFARSLNVEITQARMRAAAKLVGQVVHQRKTRLTSLGQWLGRAAIHPVGGLGFALVSRTGMYYFVGV
ncbi:MAG: ferrous iron transporter B, partial [Candidatus Marinimicrobia bacterium]|nr:ferrous iron transporter B [Candidatus Neomarinimicrobiota bacterium]